MNLEHLEYFITVAQMGSINRASPPTGCPDCPYICEIS